MDDAIIDEFEGLYLVYNARSPLSGDDLVKFMGQYKQAISGCDADLFRRAVKVWRDERPSKRFPYPQELGEIIGSLRSKDEPKVSAWRSLPPEQYAELSLAGKIRHCEILAHEYRKRAGGMRAKGKGDGWINPDRAAKYIPMAEQCQAEATRLRALLNEARRGENEHRQAIETVSDLLPFVGRAA